MQRCSSPYFFRGVSIFCALAQMHITAYSSMHYNYHYSISIMLIGTIIPPLGCFSVSTSAFLSGNYLL